MSSRQSSRKPASTPAVSQAAKNFTLQREHTLGSHHSGQEAGRALGVHQDAAPKVRNVLDSPGHPLDTNTRALMEPQFGYDFSNVRVHSDEAAAESARAVSANAYTAGPHIAFGQDKYAPDTTSGQTLIAHELTHVVQQSSEPVTGAKVSEDLFISHPADPFEQNARAKAGTYSPSTLPASPATPVLPLTVHPNSGPTYVQRSDADSPVGTTAGVFSSLFSGIGLIAAFQSAAAGERQADAAEYQATGGFNFDSYNFGPFYHVGQAIPVPGKDTQGGPDDGNELPPIPLIHVVAGDANEAVVELTLRTNGKDILGGTIEQGDSRGYGGGPRGASGNLVITTASQIANAGEVAVAAIHFRGTNHPAGKPVERFHGKVVVGANGIVYHVECSHTSGMAGVVADCNSERRPPIIVGSGRPALRENPSSGDLPVVRQRRHSGPSPQDMGPEPPNAPPPNRGIA